MKINKQKQLDKTHIIMYAALAFAVSIIILVILYNIESSCIVKYTEVVTSSKKVVEKTLYTQPGWYKYILHPILYNIAIILIVSSIGSLLLDTFAYVSYFKKRISELFIDDQIFDVLTNEYKIKMREKLLFNIYKPSSVEAENIIRILDSQTGDLLNSYFYSDHKTEIHCKLFESKNGNIFIHKRIEKTIKYKEINITKKNYTTTFLKYCCKPLNDSCIENIKLGTIKINNKPVNDKIKVIKSKNTDDPYSEIWEYNFIEPVEVNDNLIINVEYDTYVPIEDTLFSIKLDRLCEKMSCQIIYNENELDIMCQGFGSVSHGKNIIKRNRSNKCDINFNTWALAGEGVIFTIVKKC